MIPKDIKEMAKHDELVAELLALGGPLFYADYQKMRAGQAADIVRSRIRKTKWAQVVFIVIWGIYLAVFLVESNSAPYTRSPFSVGLNIFSLLLYIGPIAIAAYGRRKLMRLQARIDAGEFSTD